MSANLSPKLIGYMSLSAAFLAVTDQANAQYIYKNYFPDSLVVPDTVTGPGPSWAHADIDLNQDGIYDFSFRVLEHYWETSSYGDGGWDRLTKLHPLNGNEFAWTNFDCDNEVNDLDLGESIDASLVWKNTPAFLVRNDHTGSGFWTNCGEVDGPIPVRISVDSTGSSWHYGWIRVEATRSSILFQDQFLDTVGTVPIPAGLIPGMFLPLPPVELVPGGPYLAGGAFDCGSAGTAADISVRFYQLTGDGGTAEYRVYLVPLSDTALFQTNYASLPADRYFSIAPTGLTTYEADLPASLLGADGLPITYGKSYRLGIVSMADGIYANADTVVLATEVFELKSPPPVPPVVEAIDHCCPATANPAIQVRFHFEAAADETGISSYNVVLVPESAAAGLEAFDWKDPAIAWGAPHNRQAVTPTGLAAYEGVFEFWKTDVFDNPIAAGVDYRVMVFVVGFDSLDLSLSPASTVFSIGDGFTSPLPVGPAAPTVQNLTIADNGSTGTSSDVRLLFDPAADETDLLEYRVFLLPVGAASTFGMEEALSIPSSLSTPSRFLTLAPDGTSKNIFLGDLNDIDNNPMLPGQIYFVAVLSLSKSFWNPVSSLAFSNSLILGSGSTPVSTEIPDDGDDDSMW